MRKPRPQDFDPHYKKSPTPKPEEVDLSGVVPIKSKGKGQPDTKSSEGKPNPNQATTTPSNHGAVVSRYHDTVIEAVRKSVKEFGKEAATHRFTAEEKQKIADIVYDYKRKGIRTSENEIARIAINFLIDDHTEKGSSSLLHQVLKALNE